MVLNGKDAAAGGVFIAIGLLFGAGGLDLPMGTAFRMGPGYFPMILCGLLVLLGGIIAVRSVGGIPEELGPIPWRAILLALPMTAVFGAIVRGTGLIPAVFIVAFVSSLASRKTGPLFALVLAVGLAIFCALVFVYGLGLIIPLFGPWLRF